MSRIICPLELRSARISGVMKALFGASSAVSSSMLREPNVAGWSFCKRVFIGATIGAKSGTIRRNTFHKPMKIGFLLVS